MDGPRVRQYSLTGDLGNVLNRWQIAVQRQPGGRGGSRWIHDEVRRGDILRVGYPRNNFRLAGAPAYLFLAGGIGITPIMPMVVEAERSWIPWQLHYVGRTIEKLPFARELPQVGTTLWATESEGRPDFRGLLEAVPDGTAVYCCGPAPMISAVEALCAAREGTRRRISLHLERFARLADATAGSDTDTAFEVYLRRSNLTITVGLAARYFRS